MAPAAGASGYSSPAASQGGAAPRPTSAVTTGSDFTAAGIQELRDSKQELVLKVQSMKKELADWRSRMNHQVENYRTDLTDLQAMLTNEMSGLRSELADVKARIRAQLDSNAHAIGTLRRQGDSNAQAALELAEATAAGGGTQPQQAAT